MSKLFPVFRKSAAAGILLMALLGFSSCKDSVLDPTTKVYGKVIDSGTGQGLDSVLVQLSEDNDGPFMGSNIIKETTTDNDGNFYLNFEWVESPYKIKLTKNRYSYTRVIKGTLGLDDVMVDDYELESLKKDQRPTLEMDAFATLEVTFRNTSPSSGTDVLTYHFENLSKAVPKTQAETFSGTGERTTTELGTSGGRVVTLKYAVTENGTTRNLEENITITPFQKNQHTITY